MYILILCRKTGQRNSAYLLSTDGYGSYPIKTGGVFTMIFTHDLYGKVVNTCDWKQPFRPRTDCLFRES